MNDNEPSGPVIVPLRDPGPGSVSVFLVISRRPHSTEHGHGYLYSSSSRSGVITFASEAIADQHGDDLVLVELWRLSADGAEADAERRRKDEPFCDVWWVG